MPISKQRQRGKLIFADAPVDADVVGAGVHLEGDAAGVGEFGTGADGCGGAGAGEGTDPAVVVAFEEGGGGGGVCGVREESGEVEMHFVRVVGWLNEM